MQPSLVERKLTNRPCMVCDWERLSPDIRYYCSILAYPLIFTLGKLIRIITEISVPKSWMLHVIHQLERRIHSAQHQHQPDLSSSRLLLGKQFSDLTHLKTRTFSELKKVRSSSSTSSSDDWNVTRVIQAAGGSTALGTIRRAASTIGVQPYTKKTTTPLSVLEV